MNVWETELAEAAAHCRVYGEDRDFKELINYIKAGQSIKSQTKNDE